MRILQLIPQSKLGGAESVGFTLAAEFARRGHETLLLSNRDNGPLLARPRPSGMQAASLPRRSRLDPRILGFLFGAMARFRPDVLHAHNYEASVWARAIGLMHPQVAVVVHVHSSRFVHRHGRQRILTDRLLFRRADAVVALNELQAEFLVETIGLPRSKLFLVSNGIDTARFAPPPDLRRAPKSAVCVASLTDVKNHATLIQAWKEVVERLSGATLTLVGDGPLRARLEAQARELGLANQVRFAGLAEDVRPYLWGAEVFVLPSLNEALPLSLLEAMAAGCAPVASRVGAIPAVLAEGTTGLMVTPGDAAALAGALHAALSRTPEDAAPSAVALGLRARAEVERRFGLGPWLDRLEEIYRAASARRRGRPLTDRPAGD